MSMRLFLLTCIALILAFYNHFSNDCTLQIKPGNYKEQCLSAAAAKHTISISNIMIN